MWEVSVRVPRYGWGVLRCLVGTVRSKVEIVKESKVEMLIFSQRELSVEGGWDL